MDSIQCPKSNRMRMRRVGKPMGRVHTHLIGFPPTDPIDQSSVHHKRPRRAFATEIDRMESHPAVSASTFLFSLFFLPFLRLIINPFDKNSDLPSSFFKTLENFFTLVNRIRSVFIRRIESKVVNRSSKG